MRSRLLPVALFCSVLGVAIGVGFFTFGYAEGASYLTNDPEACANCHVMDNHYASWAKASHRAVATCNDCHTPSAFVPKYLSKAENGFWHSLAFTTGAFPDQIQIKPHNLDIVEDACQTCHEDVVAAMTGAAHAPGTLAASAPELSEGLTCTRCHGGVGHAVR